MLQLPLILNPVQKCKTTKQFTVLGIYENSTFTGYLPEKDLPNIYRIADIFVIPSIAEQSLVTMEAIASGLSIIGANAVALPHLIQNQKNGLFFQPGNALDLAEKLKILLSDDRKHKKFARESLKIIQEHDIKK